MAVEEMTALPDAAAQSVGVQARRKPLGRRIYEGRVAYIMLAPSFVFLLVFMYYPALLGLYRSAFKWAPGLSSDFVGLGNFIQLFTKDRVFVSSMDHMLQLAAWYVVSTVGVSLFIAVLIHRLRGGRTQYTFRLGMILPVVIPAIVPLMLWKFIYDIKVGPLNMILIWAGLEEWTRAWLSDPNVALYAVMLRNFPWVDGVAILILLAGLQAIPYEIVESAMIDGASEMRRFWSIELPLIAGQIKLISVLTIMWGVQEFTAVFAMTQGGPINSTMVPGMWMFWNAFRINKMGYASAIGVVLFLLTLVLTMINMKYITTEEY
jgi:raffinose/stachyose/melibiose transport system permease protein